MHKGADETDLAPPSDESDGADTPGAATPRGTSVSTPAPGAVSAKPATGWRVALDPQRLPLLILVFVGGVVSLGLEISGPRLMAPVLRHDTAHLGGADRHDAALPLARLLHRRTRRRPASRRAAALHPHDHRGGRGGADPLHQPPDPQLLSQRLQLVQQRRRHGGGGLLRRDAARRDPALRGPSHAAGHGLALRHPPEREAGRRDRHERRATSTRSPPSAASSAPFCPPSS